MNKDTIKYYSASESNKNVADAIVTDKNITFMESYMVYGQLLAAKEIYANYDLHIFGDLRADTITVLGKLYVSGDISANTIVCSNSVYCEGEIKAQEVVVDEFIFARSVICSSLKAQDVIVQGYLDVQDNIDVHGNLISGDGIMGNGTLMAENVIAINYFDFSGDIKGNVVDLSDDMLGQRTKDIQVSDQKNDKDSIEKAAAILKNSLNEIRDLEEDDYVQKIIEAGQILPNMKVSGDLIEYVDSLGYKNKIDNLYDYLILVWASCEFPPELKLYDTVEPIFSVLLEDANRRIDQLVFEPENLEQVIKALYVASNYNKSIPLPLDTLYDKLLMTIGPRYKTVLQLLRNRL